MTEYKIWTPEYSGHTQPNWREGMEWGEVIGEQDFGRSGTPAWIRGWLYKVPAEALNSPNDDASGDVDAWRRNEAPIDKRKALRGFIQIIKDYPPEMLAEEGITLAPEKDWATELSEELRELYLYDQRNEAIALIRERVVLKGEG